MADLSKMVARKRAGKEPYKVTSDAQSKLTLQVAEGAWKKFLAYRDYYNLLAAGDTELYAFQACRPGETFTRDIILGHRQEGNTSVHTSLARSSENFAGGSRLTSLEIDRKGMTIRGWAHVHPFQHSGKPNPSGIDRRNNITLLYSRQGSPTCRVRLNEFVHLLTDTSVEEGNLVLHNSHTGQDYMFKIPEGVDPSKMIIPELMIRSPVEDTFIWSMIINGRSDEIGDAYVEYLTQRISRLGETQPEGPFSIQSAQIINVEDDLVLKDSEIIVEIMDKISFRQPLTKVCERINDQGLQEEVREQVKGWENYEKKKREGYWIITLDAEGNEIDAKETKGPKIKKMWDYQVKKMPIETLAILDGKALAKNPLWGLHSLTTYQLESLKKSDPAELKALKALDKKDLEALDKLTSFHIEKLKEQRGLEKVVEEAPVEVAAVQQEAYESVAAPTSAEKTPWYKIGVSEIVKRILEKLRGKEDYGNPRDVEVDTPYGKGTFVSSEAPQATPEQVDKARKISQAPLAAPSGSSYEHDALYKGEHALSAAEEASKAGVDALAQKAFSRAKQIKDSEEKKD